MNNKRGLSSVVTSLIMILLVLVSVGIVWVVVKNIIESGTEDISLEKFSSDLKIKSVTVDNSTNTANINVKRNPGQGDLAGIKFVFSDGLNSEIIESNLTLEELEENVFSFILNNLSVSNIQTVSIALLYKKDSKAVSVGSISSFKVGAGNIVTGGSQNNQTQTPVCGNSFVETGEQCDDGNTINGDGCDSNCQIEVLSVCGNGLIESGEQCDDNNLVNGDGCSLICNIESGWTCNSEPSVCSQIPQGDTTPPITTASVSGGTYTSAQTVNLNINEAGTTYYTLDGTNPTTSSSVYSISLTISSTTTLKYFSVDIAGNQEAVKTENYVINIPQTVLKESGIEYGEELKIEHENGKIILKKDNKVKKTK